VLLDQCFVNFSSFHPLASAQPAGEAEQAIIALALHDGTNVVVGLNTSSRCCQPRFLPQLCKPHGGAGDVSAFVDPFIPASRSVKARGQDEVPTNSLHINIRQQAIPAAKCPFEVVMKPALTSGAD